MLTLKSDGHLVCDDSSGYGITLGEVSVQPRWDIRHVLDGPVYGHVRRSFQEGRPPWPGVCEGCHTFSRGGAPHDTLARRVSLMVEPTLACQLACPSCRRKVEAKTRPGDWDLDPRRFEALLASLAKNAIEVEQVHYLGWGEPFLYPRLAELTQLARRYHPDCAQEATTSGSVPFADFLEEVELDRLIISCDGVRQESYVQYRRNGSIALVFELMAQLGRFRSKPFVEWKYILFDHNDSDDDILLAQEQARAFGLQSLLFIITNSKGASRRFTPDTIETFPLRHDFVTISPAAGIMTTREAGVILPEVSQLGDKAGMSLFVDLANITNSNILELRGWALNADGSYIDAIECFAGPDRLAVAVPRDRRRDVTRARPHAAGPDCGFIFRIPLRGRRAINALTFRARAGERSEDFSAVIHFADRTAVPLQPPALAVAPGHERTVIPIRAAP
jgi:organic radical activating enzyme